MTSLSESKGIEYRYRTISVSHLPEMRERVQRLNREGRLGQNPVFQDYLETYGTTASEELPQARSIIIMAHFIPMMRVNFHLDGRIYDVPFPPNYFNHGISNQDLFAVVQTEIIGEGNVCRVEPAPYVYMKTLATCSGLAAYGRNNISYVDWMGSMIRLSAFYTDCLLEDHWQSPRMLELCENCKVCTHLCPTGVIGRDGFVINVDRCIPLYNEIPGEIPDWIPRKGHNALMGCLRCQLTCPANHTAMQRAGRMEDVTEEETRAILDGKPTEALLQSLNRKLNNFYPTRLEEDFPVLTRNLSLLIP